MKKLLFLLIAVLATSLFGMAAGESTTLSWSFKTNQTATLTSSPVTFNAVTTPDDVNGTWVLEFTGTITAQKDKVNGPRFGTTKAPLPAGTSLSLSGSEIPSNAVITGVTFTTKGNAGASVSTWKLSVNGTAVAGTKTFATGNTENSIEWTGLNLVGNEIVLTATSITAGIHFAGVSVSYTENTGNKTEVVLEFSPSESSQSMGGTFVAPTFSKSVAEANVSFVVEGEEGILSVDTNGNISSSLERAGTATVVASIDGGDEKYYATPARYTLTVTDPNAPKVVYSSTEGDDFELENPADLAVWTHDSYNYLKATAYKDKTNHVCEGAMAISPVIDASEYKNITLDFSAAYNYFGSVDRINEFVSVLVKAEGDDEWTKLNDITTPDGFEFGWTFISYGKVSLPISNESIRVAFKYTSTEDVAGTWEIKNIVVEGVLGQGKADPGLSFGDVTEFSIEGGQTFTAPTLTKPEGLNVTYTSSNTEVASVDEATGAVTLGTAYGTTTITATSEETDTYKADRASYTLTVTDPNVLLPAEISYTTTSFTVEEHDDAFTAPQLNNPHSLPVTYSSNNEESVTVDSNNGNVTILAAGTAEITATFAGNDEYAAATATYTIIVKKPVVPGENVYQMVTSSNQLEAGAKYVIISKPLKSGTVQYGPYVLASAKGSHKGFDGIELEESVTELRDSYAIEAEGVTYFTLESAGSGSWYMVSDGQYLDGSTIKEMKLSDSANTTLTITPSADGAELQMTSGDRTTKLEVVATNGTGGVKGSITFNNYDSDQSPVALFKQVVQQAAPAVPTVVVNNVEITDFDTNYNLNKKEVTVVLTAPEGHYVHHKYVINNAADTPNQLRGIEPEEGFTANNTQEVTLKIKENGELFFYSIHPESGAKSKTAALTFIGGTTSISEIGAAEADEAEWFDVQGRRVANPAKGGIYIVKQGSKVSKRIL